MRRPLTILATTGVVITLSGISFGQPPLPAQRVKASGSHTTFEWLFIPLGLAYSRGIWAQNGLVDPEFAPSASSAGQLRQQVDSGVEIGLVNTAEVLLARSQGTPVKIVAGFLGETLAKLYVPAASSMKTAKDLDGKKIGILTATHTSYRAVHYLNGKLGITAEAVPLGAFPDRLAALKAGTVDAIYASEGTPLTLVDSGELTVLVGLRDVYPRPYTAVVVWATDDLIAHKPDTVRRFVKALLEAVRYSKEHSDEAIALYMKKTNAPPNVASRVVRELNTFFISNGKGSGDSLPDAVAGCWQFTKASGAIPPETTVSIAEAVDPRFLPSP
ncbi:MAG: ABC transporter substrate-binding protein [Thermoanaerobaculia bacterium]|nr:ABC transporter substrate-binding protein [Thermoanaerobaculia bacterium]